MVRPGISTDDIDKLSSFTPFHCAASRNADVVLRLIHYKADVNACESSGKTPLHFATWT
jgi:ankyrin repeat protein